MGMHWELKETTVGTREKWKKSSTHPPSPSPPLHSQTLKGKKPRHFECMIEPTHWLHKISLPKRVHHHFCLGYTISKTPYLLISTRHKEWYSPVDIMPYLYTDTTIYFIFVHYKSIR
jgi:hypothetical protein